VRVIGAAVKNRAKTLSCQRSWSLITHWISITYPVFRRCPRGDPVCIVASLLLGDKYRRESDDSTRSDAKAYFAGLQMAAHFHKEKYYDIDPNSELC
jgi:hypothetical protein